MTGSVIRFHGLANLTMRSVENTTRKKSLVIQRNFISTVDKNKKLVRAGVTMRMHVGKEFLNQRRGNTNPVVMPKASSLPKVTGMNLESMKVSHNGVPVGIGRVIPIREIQWRRRSTMSGGNRG